MTPRFARATAAKTSSVSTSLFVVLLLLLSLCTGRSTPANKSALEKHFGSFLPKEASRCTTCHLPSDKKLPETLDEFPHNAFGDRLRSVRNGAGRSGQKQDIATALALVANEDADHDGVANEIEILLGRNPGDAKDTPDDNALRQAPIRQKEFAAFLASYRWEPFKPVRRPGVPQVKTGDG